MYPRDGGVHAQGILHHVELAVVEHLVQSRRVAQMLLLECVGVAVQRLVAEHLVALGVAALQVIAQAIRGQQLTDLLLEGRRIALQILERGHGHLARERTGSVTDRGGGQPRRAALACYACPVFCRARRLR
ncbi:hypothetical protein D3C77_623140 [compost metagenome]